MTLAEIKKELKGFKSYTVNTILVDEDEFEGFTVDICATVTDVYGNFDSHCISLDGFETEADAMKRAKMLGTKLDAKVEIANC